MTPILWSNLPRWQSNPSLPISVLLLMGFAAFLVLQHSLVFLYHDDWGMAVLDYVVQQSGFAGRDYSLSQVLEFLGGMYEHWTGRIVAHFFHIYAEKAGLWFVRIFQSILIVSTILLAQSIADRTASKPWDSLSTAVAIFLFLALPVGVLCTGVYWFTAASVYLWGIPLFLAGGRLVALHQRLTVASVGLLAVAAMFHEQLAFAVCAYLLGTFLLGGLGSRAEWPLFLARISPVIALSALNVLAPGNFLRKSKSAAFYQDHEPLNIILANANSIATTFFWPQAGNLYSLVVPVSLVMAIWWLANQRKDGVPKYAAISVGLFGTLGLLYLMDQRILFSITIVIAYSIVLTRIANALQLGRYVAPLYFAAICSLLPLLYAPVVPARAGVPLLFLQIPVIVFLVGLAGQQIRRPVVIGAVLVLGVFALKNAAFVYRGYLGNLEANRINDYTLSVASYWHERGATRPQPLQLVKLTNPRFAETMPYDRPLIERWIKKYYRLPLDTKFEWNQ